MPGPSNPRHAHNSERSGAISQDNAPVLEKKRYDIGEHAGVGALALIAVSVAYARFACFSEVSLGADSCSPQQPTGGCLQASVLPHRGMCTVDRRGDGCSFVRDARCTPSEGCSWTRGLLKREDTA